MLSDASQGIAVNGYASRIWKEDVLCSLRAVNLTRGLKELLYSQDIIAPYYTKTGIYLSMPVFCSLWLKVGVTVQKTGLSTRKGKELGLEVDIKGRLAKIRSQNEAGWKLFILLFIIVAIFILSFALGRYPVPPGQLLEVLASRVFSIETHWDATVETVIFQVRLPRIFAAILVGAALSAAGAAYQGMFKNPLVSPDILGASAGAGFGAALAIYFSFSMLGIQLMAFVGGLLAVGLTYGISMRIRHDPMLALVLSGIMIGSLFTAAISCIKYVADPYDKLPAITFWLMGSLASITPRDVYMVLTPIVLGCILLYLMRWRLNVLAMGEEEAQVLGINTRVMKTVVIICCTLMTAAAVSISGMIGWVGLVIPHLARMIVGPNYQVLLPASILLGGAYLLLVDDLARLMASMEIPLGILTALIGVPFFLYLLLNSKWGWK